MGLGGENPTDATEVAVEALQGLGLTQYQSRVYAGLYRIQRGTARDVANESGVPRARVYDILDALHEHGLVDVQQSAPREYLAVPIETAIEILKADHHKHEAAVQAALADVEREQALAAIEQEGVWVITDRERILALESEFIERATNRIIFGIASAEVFDEATARALEVASKDVEVVVETVDEDTIERFEERAGIEVMTPDRGWRDTPELEGNIGRILLVDDRHVLVSTVDGPNRRFATPNESAVWTSGGGPGDGLVITLREFMRERVADRVRSAGSER